jgi:hypothetical protein
MNGNSMITPGSKLGMAVWRRRVSPEAHVLVLARNLPVRAWPAARCCFDWFGQFEKWREFVAQKVQTLVVDDIDGSAAEGTVRFGLDGTDYEIDLNAANAQALRDALAPYVTAGRRAGGAARRAARGGRRAPANGVNTTEVREWAKAQGIEVKDRGRVPAELVVKFKAAAAG